MSHPPSIRPGRAGASAAIRQASTFCSRSLSASGMPAGDPPRHLRADLCEPPARTNLGAGIGSRRCVTTRSRADQPNRQPRDHHWCRTECRCCHPASCPPPDGISAKCESPSRPSMSRMTARSSAGVFAAAARGLSSVAHGVPVEAVHRLVEMRVADDRPRRVERFARPAASGPTPAARCSRRATTATSERAKSPHLMSALICAGGSNVEGGTLSHSNRREFQNLFDRPSGDCFIVVGTSRPPNFL